MNYIEKFASDFVNKQLSQPPTPGAAAPADRSVLKGMLAGLAAGAVATAAKSLAERLYPPRTEGQPEPPDVLADKVADTIAGHELSPGAKAVASETIHWVFGITAGAAYGVLAEFYPAATSRRGVSFGMTLMALTHESALPAFGLSETPGDQTPREKTSEMATHMVYGLVAETVRRSVRKAL